MDHLGAEYSIDGWKLQNSFVEEEIRKCHWSLDWGQSDFFFFSF